MKNSIINKKLKIAIASGKGGTGKTTLAVNWSKLLSEKYKVALYDLDVEEPDCHIYLDLDHTKTLKSTRKLPVVDEDICDYCGICSQKCEFNAIAVGKDFFLLFPELCHSCGRCINICPRNAFSEVDDVIGEINYYSNDLLELIEGKLNIGSVLTKYLIHDTKLKNPEKLSNPDFIIYDCPPGNTCPMVEAIKDADYVILVTEPTPFGLHDLSISIDVTLKMEKPVGIVINKSSDNDRIIEEYCSEKDVPIIGRIAFSRQAAKVSAAGGLLISIPEIKNAVEEISKNCIGVMRQ